MTDTGCCSNPSPWEWLVFTVNYLEIDPATGVSLFKVVIALKDVKMAALFDPSVHSLFAAQQTAEVETSSEATTD